MTKEKPAFYVDRDDDRRIVSIHVAPDFAGHEKLPQDAPEILALFGGEPETQATEIECLKARVKNLESILFRFERMAEYAELGIQDQKEQGEQKQKPKTGKTGKSARTRKPKTKS